MSVAHQPLDPEVLPRLDPDYVKFHEEVLQYIVPPHTLPWSPEIRNAPAVPGSSAVLDCDIKDYPLSHTSIRSFTPKGTPPTEGWPVFLFYHGGGWTLGSINSENAFCSNMCVRANCVVVSVDYRLAPEHQYPIAVEDTVESIQWVHSKGKELLNINPNKIAIGGSSSGGNLAAIGSLKASQLDPPIPIVFQLLIVPVTDNTASETNDRQKSWKENEKTPWLGPERMHWFVNNYLPNKEDWTKWDASPIFAPDELAAKSPKTWIAVCEMDILRDEGIAYGEKLKKLGVEVETKVYKGAPHPIMAMDGCLPIGAQMVTDASEALAKAFK
ncbi:alpha/beta hydrolase fold-domain-containing protein [Schizophyllum commune]